MNRDYKCLEAIPYEPGLQISEVIPYELVLQTFEAIFYELELENNCKVLNNIFGNVH